MAAALATTATEEVEHAILAWRYLDWALAQGDEQLRGDIARIFGRMEEYAGLGAEGSQPAPEEQMRAHGYLPWDERRRIAEAILAEVIRPAAHALLSKAARGKRHHGSPLDISNL